ncbi:interleukin-3 [Dipodomys spectabilis]|uniref:interleukin-3 n=1 Tax=Dipodomys spectabilis TaxID=105255 RepID=UPI001C54AC82|nr:interleukin-3 [Dipodomys spectabilis]
MQPTRPNSSRLQILLLLLFLFRSGFQAPTTLQDTTQPSSNSKPVNCSWLVIELEHLIDNKSSEPIISEFELQLMDTSLLKPNLCAFLEAAKTLNDVTNIERIRKNLKTLRQCLPEATPLLMGGPIFITEDDPNDFRKKLKSFVRVLSEQTEETLSFRNSSVTPTAAPGSSHHELVKC